MSQPDWLEVKHGSAPLIVSFPHTGTDIPADISPRLRSLWLACKDTDWWIDQLYDFAHEEFGATTIRSRISRTCIDLNRDPSGCSLYPGHATSELCPTTTFDGEPLYSPAMEPTAAEIERRTETYFAPYHQALSEEIDRLRETHPRVVLYDAHSIRSFIPRLFQGELPKLNLGTYDSASCAAELELALASVLADSGMSHVLNGRFKGGWITRHCGSPANGIHAVQMEIACRAYMPEPASIQEETWPPSFDAIYATPLRKVLRSLLQAALRFTSHPSVEHHSRLGEL